MTREPVQHLVRQLRKRIASGRADSLSDRELVERFAARRDEDAFAALVRRHGPMVLGVCRRVLHDAHAAEDAFQAAFLILSRKAASLRRAEAVGSWLYGVASRLAQQARMQTVRRQLREGQTIPPQPKSDPLAELSVREAQAILGEELARLPEKYRAPLVLCYLEGQTRDEAARRLGWSEGLVKSRLQQGRDRLRHRLVHRGLTLSTALLATLLTDEIVAAAVPMELMRATVEAARAWSSGTTAAGVSEEVVVLVEAALRGMALSKLKFALSVLLLFGAFAAGAGMFAQTEPAAEQPEPPSVAKASAKVKEPVRTDRYGDPLPTGAVARLGSLRLYHGQQVERVTLSPDEKWVVSTAREDGNRLWDAVTGRERPLREELRQAAVFSTRDKLLAVQKRDQDLRLQLWDVLRGEKIGDPVAMKMQLPVTIHLFEGLCLSPDGRTLVAGNANFFLCFCDMVGGKAEEPIRLKQGSGVYAAQTVFSADSKTLAVQYFDGTIRVWEVPSRTEKWISRPRPNDQGGHISLSPDGTILATASFSDTRFRLWDLRTFREFPPLAKHPEEPVRSIAFSPDGKQLTTTYYRGATVSLWDLATGKEVRRFQGKDSHVYHTVFSADGKTLVGADGYGVTFWDLDTGKFRHDFGHTYMVDSVHFSPDGRKLVSGAAYTDNVVRVWNPLTGEQTAQLRGHLSGIEVIAYAPDGKLIATGSQDESIRLWDSATGREVRKLEAKDGMIYAMAFTPDGKLLASGGKRMIHLWDATNGRKVRSFDKPGGFTLRLAFAPDGKTLASRAMGDNGVRLWDMAKGETIRRLAGSGGGPVFSPDGRTLATGGDDGAVRLWDVVSGEERRALLLPSRGEQESPRRLHALAFSPDGRTLAAGYGDRIVRLWEVCSGRERARYEGHRNEVCSLAFSPDGTLLASGGVDRLIMVWDVRGQKMTGHLRKSDFTLGELNALWNDLGEEDAARAYRAILALLAAGERAVSLCQDRLRPAAAIDGQRIDRLIADLDSDQYATRQKALRELRELGDGVELALWKALAGKPSVEQRLRIKELLQELDAVRSPHLLRQLRAVEVLEHLGTLTARKVLRTLAGGAPEARLTREAKASLDRLERWASARHFGPSR